MTWGHSDCREGAKRCDKENQRGDGYGVGGGGNRSLPCSSSFFFLATPTSRCTPISQHVEHANSKTPFFSSRYCMFCLLFMQLVSAVQKRKDKI